MWLLPPNCALAKLRQIATTSEVASDMKRIPLLDADTLWTA